MNLDLTSIATVGAVVSVVTEVLKKSPKIPVNSGNAMVVVFVLAVIISFVPVVLGGDLTNMDAGSIASNVTIIFGAATILYETVKKVWDKLQSLRK